MKKVFVDTNIFLETLIKRDKKEYLQCVRLFEGARDKKIKLVTAVVVMAEVAWTLKSFYGFSRQKVANGLESIYDLPGLSMVDDYDLSVAISMYKNHGVKFIDALVASIKPVREKEWVVVSYDKDFDKLGVVRKEPKELVK
ncbi:PIN domain-containing protein [Patescibacteria group bacterium]|nr:PIN domain-containing protein [Patescibacteria group bacterium]